MQTAFVIVSILAAAALTFSATAVFVRYEKVLENMRRAHVPPSWLMPLGGLKAAGALGLVVGIFIPTIGVAAAAGVTLLFIGAIVTHVLARWYSFGFPAIFLVLGASALGLGLAAN